MKRHARLSLMVLTILIASFGASRPALSQEDARTLPTLLIKGDVVSLNADDPSESLIKVKDRYGFETPIYVSGKTKFFEGESEVLKDKLAEGQEVEVEYSFDINTAKRFAVVMKLPPSKPDEDASKFVPAPEAPEPAPVATKTEEAAEGAAAEAEGAAQESPEAVAE